MDHSSSPASVDGEDLCASKEWNGVAFRCWQHAITGLVNAPIIRHPTIDWSKFRSQTSDNMDRWKSRGGKSQRGEEKQWEDEKRKRAKKEDAGARKRRKVAIHCVFPMVCGSGGSKSRLAKVAGAGPCGQMRHVKLHAVVARSTFPTQNVQSTSSSEHF